MNSAILTDVSSNPAITRRSTGAPSPGPLGPETSSPSLLPAIIHWRSGTDVQKVAGLSLLDRLVVMLHRAGCAPIRIVCDDKVPDVPRARALGIPFEVLAEMPSVSGPVVVAAPEFLADISSIRAVVQRGGRLTATDGTPLSLGMIDDWLGGLNASLDRCTRMAPSGWAAAVIDVRSASDAERRLWQSLTSKSDGFVDRAFNRPLGRLLSKVLIYTPVTPNQISVASMIVGLIGAYYLWQGNYAAAVLGALLFQLSAVVDCVDGDIARVLFKETKLGERLDIILDQVVHLAIFAAMAAGLYRQGSDVPFLALGIAAAIGVLLSGITVIRVLFRSGGEPNRALKRLLELTATRDFSVLVLALAVVNHLDWMLWLTAIGANLFWMAVLALQMPVFDRDPR